MGFLKSITDFGGSLVAYVELRILGYRLNQHMENHNVAESTCMYCRLQQDRNDAYMQGVNAGRSVIIRPLAKTRGELN